MTFVIPTIGLTSQKLPFPLVRDMSHTLLEPRDQAFAQEAWESCWKKQTVTWLKAPRTWRDPLIHADGSKTEHQGTVLTFHLTSLPMLRKNRALGIASLKTQ